MSTSVEGDLSINCGGICEEEKKRKKRMKKKEHTRITLYLVVSTHMWDKNSNNDFF